jgi:hypothetical protein
MGNGPACRDDPPEAASPFDFHLYRAYRLKMHPIPEAEDSNCAKKRFLRLILAENTQ